MIVDAAIIVVVGVFTWRGIRRGLVGSLAGLVGFVVAATVAVLTYASVGRVLASALGISRAVAYLAAAVAIFVALSLGFFVAGRALTTLLRLTKWGKLNAAAGGALSGAWALAWVTAVLLAITAVPTHAAWRRAVDDSALAQGIVDGAPGMAAEAHKRMRSMLAIFTPSEQKVALIATTDFRAFPVAERELFDLANRERRARGLAALRWSVPVAAVARHHASDMLRRGYFAHETPEHRSPGERLQLGGVAFTLTAENLGLAPTVAEVHARLMASAAHRRNILSPRYERLGIGAVFGPQGVLVAEEFVTP